MVGDYLDFEKPIAALEKKILDFQSSEEYEKNQPLKFKCSKTTCKK